VASVMAEKRANHGSRDTSGLLIALLTALGKGNGVMTTTPASRSLFGISSSTSSFPHRPFFFLPLR
jgi:hypothetical protein